MARERDGTAKMVTGRRRHSSEFKAKVALEALKGQKTLNELANEFGVHPVQIAQWKQQAQVGLAGVFESPNSRHERVDQAPIEQLNNRSGSSRSNWTGCAKRGGLGRGRAGLAGVD